MQKFLGDEEEEKRRKDELRSIVSATFYGLVFGSLIGALLGGYGGFLIGMFAGAFLLSLFSVLGVKATRQRSARGQKKPPAASPS
jgi:predicted lipid-binding transport protein (Tim44 family)